MTAETRIPVIAPKPDVAEATRAKIAGAVTPVAPLAPAWRRGGAAAAIGLAAGLIAAFASGPRALTPEVLATSTALAVVAVLAAIAAARHAVPGAQPGRLVDGLLVAIPILFALSQVPMLTGGGFVTPRCLFLGLAFALPGAAASAWVVARGFATQRLAAGAIAGLAATLTGLLAIELTCPVTAAPHVLAFHAGIPLVGALVGAAIAALAPRS